MSDQARFFFHPRRWKPANISFISAMLLLLMFASVRAQNANFAWAKAIGDGNGQGSEQIETDNAGNTVTLGRSFYSVDIDPGPGVFTIPNASSATAWNFIVKLDASGNFLWGLRLAHPVGRIRIDANGDIYLRGIFGGTVDFDPGAGVSNMTGMSAMCIVKLDAGGNFVWAKQIDVLGAYQYGDLSVDGSGNVFASAYVNGNSQIDLDPGPGTFNVTTSSGPNNVVVKLDNAANFVWGAVLTSAQSIAPDAAGNLYTSGQYLSGFWPSFSEINKFDPVGNLLWTKTIGVAGMAPDILDIAAGSGGVYASGQFGTSVDFDPGSGVFNMTSTGGDAFLMKLDPSGNFLWAKQISTSSPQGEVFIHSIDLDAQGNIYSFGTHDDQADFDPGPGISNLPANGNRATFVLKLNQAGSFNWVKPVVNAFFTATGGSYFGGISVDNSGDVYTSSIFNQTNDFDAGTGVFNLTPTTNGDVIFIHKMTQDSCSSFALVVDSLSAIGCSNPQQGYVSVQATGATAPYAYTWNVVPAVVSQSLTVTNPGIYSVTASDVTGCTMTTSLLVNGPGSPSGWDLNANLVSNPFTPGFVSNITVDGFNDGCQPQSGSLKLVLTNQVSYNSSVPVPDQILGDTLVWNFTNIDYGSPHLTPHVSVTTNSLTPIGDTVCLTTIITPVSGDADMTNNTKTYCHPVAGSFDPNDKHVFPAGACAEGYITPGTHLTYTVNFQNTGTATAQNVYILDSLDSHLNPNSVRIIGSSHTMYTEVIGGNVLKFRFDGINLPDSNANEPASHGYVIYEADLMSGVPNNTQVTNKAGIYFDVNVPVYTNTVKNTVVSTIPNCSGVAVSDITTAKDFALYPNPATGAITISYKLTGSLELRNMTGRLMLSRKLVSKDKENTATINVSSLPAGVYIYSFRSAGAEASGKLMVLH